MACSHYPLGPMGVRLGLTSIDRYFSVPHASPHGFADERIRHLWGQIAVSTSILIGASMAIC